MRKCLIFIIMSTLLLTACNKKIDAEGITLDELKTIVSTINKYDNDTVKIMAKAAMSLLNFGKEYNYTYIPDDTIQIVAVKADDPQAEFDCYYNYAGEGIDIVWEFGFKGLYIKTVDEDGIPLFEFYFYPDGKTFTINPEYQNIITIK